MFLAVSDISPFLAADKGIQTGPDSKYFSIYSELKKPFTNDGKELVLQVR